MSGGVPVGPPDARRRGIAGPIIVLVVVCGYLAWKAAPLLAGAPVDEGLPSLVGSWTRDIRNGRETMTIRADGTASWFCDVDWFSERHDGPVDGTCTVDTGFVPHRVAFDFPDMFGLVGVYELAPDGGLRLDLVSPDFECFQGAPTGMSDHPAVLTRVVDTR